MAPAFLKRAEGSLRIGRALRLVWESAPVWSAVSLLLVMVQGALPLAAIYLLKLIIDEVSLGLVAPDPLLAWNRVAFFVGLAAAVALLTTVLRTAIRFVQEVQGLLVTEHVFGVLHAKSAELDLSYYEDPSYQDTFHRTQQEAPSRPPMVVRALLALAQGSVTLIGVVILLATLHWLLVALLTLAVLPGLWARVRFSNRTYQWMRRSTAAERQSSYLNMLLTNPWFAKEVRMWGLGPILIDRFQEVRAVLRRERIAISKSRDIADSLTQAVATLTVFGALAFLATQTLAGAITIGGLVMYFQAVQKGQSVFSELLGNLAGLYEHNLFLTHLEEFLALEPQIVAPPSPAPVPRPLQQGIVISNVGFRYPGAASDALNGIDLTLHRGEMVAIVGANGSGKTTLIKLLLRMYNPASGTIKLDGVDIRSFDPEELRRQIAVVFQDHEVYAVSVRENIWFGNVHDPIDEGRVLEAAARAGADDFIHRLTRGYDTTLLKMFEGGQDISGGERQKLALARAFYGDSQILILDEPSSALDPEAEAQLFEQIRLQTTDRATIVISHRFSTVRMADRIYVMDRGRIIEGGSHDELMRKGGTYARLFELQARQFGVDPGRGRSADAGQGTGIPLGTPLAGSGLQQGH